MKEVVVIGGGVVGLCAAYYLEKMGHTVSIFDQSSMDFGASYVNAGFISPSHFIPLASPGVMKQALRWMFDSSSPIYMKPRIIAPGFLQWLWAFNKSCSQENVSRAMHPLKDLALMGQQLFSKINENQEFDFHMESKGIVTLCKTGTYLEMEEKRVELVQEFGMNAKILSAEALQKLEPYRELDVIGGSLYLCDWHSTPGGFMEGMKKYLQKAGVKIYPNEAVKNIKLKKERIEKLSTTSRTIEADEFVLAAGAWSQCIVKKIGFKLLLEAGKGYRINTTQETNISMPAVLAENKVAVTPMKGFTRFAGTMEISGINSYIRKGRVRSIADSVAHYYPGLKVSATEREAATSGLRPLSPDGRPYIGKSNKCPNLTFATAHAMMGWTMAPSTGKLVAELISEKKPSMDIEAFHPDRRF